MKRKRMHRTRLIGYLHRQPSGAWMVHKSKSDALYHQKKAGGEVMVVRI